MKLQSRDKLEKVINLLTNDDGKSLMAIPKKSAIIVAVSGGPDSVFLLYLLKKILKDRAIAIIVAHVNHKLRGKESEKDQKFVEKLCKKLEVKLEVATLPKITKGNVEELARNFRYDFFNSLQKKYKATHIITAHHADDNVETVIMNMARGSFARGLKGMDFHGGVHRNLLRPLLNLSKADILKYLKTNKIPFRIDKSNIDEKYSRNFIRHKIVPLFKKLNPNFTETFQKNIQLFGEVDSTLSGLSKEWIVTHFSQKTCPTKIFTRQTSLFQECILTELYQQIYGYGINLSQQHIQNIKTIIRQNISGKKKEFGHQYFLIIKRNTRGEKVMELQAQNK
jgi:tRNA(Ile)-lysidine synthase